MPRISAHFKRIRRRGYLGRDSCRPVITRYEVVPAAVFASRKFPVWTRTFPWLRAQSVRILARYRARPPSALRCEPDPVAVGMREILESEDWGGAKASSHALGKDVSGKPSSPISQDAALAHRRCTDRANPSASIPLSPRFSIEEPKDVRLIMVIRRWWN